MASQSALTVLKDAAKETLNVAASMSSQLQSLEQQLDDKDVQDATIFVSIVNYRDGEGQFTLKDLLEKAANQDRVRIGYCLQYDAAQDSDFVNAHYAALYQQKGKNIRALFMPHREARGPMYARWLVQKRLFQNEKYYLQVDCHMRFIRNWDSILIQQYQACRDKKAVITTYPNGYDSSYVKELKQFTSIEDWDGTDKVSVQTLENRSSLLCAEKFGNDGFLRLRSKQFQSFPSQPVASSFYAAGFNFSLSTVIQDCANRTGLRTGSELKCLFFGEESLMALRLFSHGYNFYAPTRAICYHLWNRSNVLRKGVWRELFEDDSIKAEMTALEQNSKSAVQAILNGEVDGSAYGIGKERTLQQYEKLCGVSFKAKKMSDEAMYGGINEKEREAIFAEFQQNKLMDLISSFQT